MFQTEPNHFLQSFDSPAIYWLMDATTRLGYNSAFIAVAIVLIFGIHMKKAFLATHMLIWTGFAGALLKDFFALPRPENVDSSLKHLVNEFNAVSPFVRKGGQSFFSLPAPEAIEYYRENKLDSHGFPSGHVSGSVAYWGGIALLFNRTWVRVAAIIIIALMPFSRMYLGRHFLADVLGGLVLGGITVWLAWFFLIKKNKLSAYLSLSRLRLQMNMPTLIFISSCVILPIVFIFLGNSIAAQFLGLNIAFLLIGLQGFPSDEGKWPIRVLRVVLAIVVLVGSSILLDQLIRAVGLKGNNTVLLMKRALEMFLLIWGSTAIAKKLGWYKSQTG
ncbi:phosphatase PAP2 family protein [Imperialibacter roseus]|uniref:Phosphatase PAP2 family protein n=1 Tax=Imperialibacter roseus TaxID=1324217 RepID=A0ABZ0IJ74_9BACT|nr:phosphatase PAP2 family protein [Imperialibacter roseus]WOK04370.1 phosphatase PAP2 family protein [Imperialibacter roseus]|tara:strand:+ start:1590 stop:2585 length:996 start_codon:yes stop_codon:yes gene_type:complete